MGWVIFDTETSGLFDFKLAADAEGQARLAQIGLILATDEGDIEDAWDMYVRPDGWAMEPGATAVNGLTDEFLMEHGVPIGDVLDRWNGLVDDGRLFTSYNAQFDMKVMRGELRRAGRSDRFEEMKNSCLMRSCKQHGVEREDGSKRGWPKLSDACRHFGIEQAGRHTAHGDASAHYHVWRHLTAIDALIPPTIHYAKNPPQKGNADGAE